MQIIEIENYDNPGYEYSGIYESLDNKKYSLGGNLARKY